MPQPSRLFAALLLAAFLSAGCASSPAAEPLRVQVEPNGITLFHQDAPILNYQTALIEVPPGVNPLFRRSGFVHPLWSPDGRIYTRIQPPDHYHHYGIWNPWTKVMVEGQEVDFWNLAKGQGTVRFAGLLGRRSASDAAGFTVRQEHVQFRPDAPERVVLDEKLQIQASLAQLNDRPAWIIDWTSTLKNTLDSPVELSAYRYGGGIGFRATADWNTQTSAILTSQGHQRDTADGTRARWCDILGWTDSPSPAGLLFLSHPDNRQHPEPMRVWPPSSKDVYFEFCPIRHEPWTLEPGREYVLRYRLVAYDGRITPENAESLWRNFANPANPSQSD